MNKYIGAGIRLAIGVLKFSCVKLFHWNGFRGSLIHLVSPGTEITLERGAELSIDRMLKMHSGSKLRVRKGGKVRIGKNLHMGNQSFIVAYEEVTIGDDVQFGPGVKVYDQDHDFRAEGGINAKKYLTAPIHIGNNVWIGADCILLRGTTIGDNSVIAAGSVVKGNVPENTILVQKRENAFYEIQTGAGKL